jgi:hypothetical protein
MLVEQDKEGPPFILAYYSEVCCNVFWWLSSAAQGPYMTLRTTFGLGDLNLQNHHVCTTTQEEEVLPTHRSCLSRSVATFHRKPKLKDTCDKVSAEGYCLALRTSQPPSYGLPAPEFSAMLPQGALPGQTSQPWTLGTLQAVQVNSVG